MWPTGTSVGVDGGLLVMPTRGHPNCSSERRRPMTNGSRRDDDEQDERSDDPEEVPSEAPAIGVIDPAVEDPPEPGEPG